MGWSGIEHLLADFNRELILASGGNIGHDLTLRANKRESDLDKDVFKVQAKKFGKHKILFEIQNILGIRSDTDTSRGSTVTMRLS